MARQRHHMVAGEPPREDPKPDTPDETPQPAGDPQPDHTAEQRPGESASQAPGDEESDKGQADQVSDDDKPSTHELFTERLTPLLSDGTVKNFDPFMILAILSALIPLIQNCFIRSPSRLRTRVGNTMLLVATLRQSEGLKHLSRAELRRVADKVFDVADNSTEQELEEFIKDCCG